MKLYLIFLYLDAEGATEFGLLCPSETLWEYRVGKVPEICQ